MKTLIFFMLVFCLVTLKAQLTINMDVADHYTLSNPNYGMHTSDFFEHCACYDPDLPGGGIPAIDQCMDYAASMKPQVLRFPSGGSSKFMHLLDDRGYGYRQSEIDNFYTDGFMPVDEYMDFSTAVDNQELLAPGTNYLERFIDLNFGMYAYTTVMPKVIYVAKVLDSPYEVEDIIAYNLAVLDKMINVYGLNVVGVEMGNEIYSTGWEAFPGFLNSDQYLSTVKPIMQAIRTNYPTLKIGVVAAPEPEYFFSIDPNPLKYAKYKQWNSRLKIKGTSPEYTTLIDAFIIHLYMFDNAYPDCAALPAGNLYDDYEDAVPYNIDFAAPDPLLFPPFECAKNAYNQFTKTDLFNIYDNYVSGFTYSLGTTKKYWITEWGLQPAAPFGNTFVESNFVMQYLLNMAEISDNISPGSTGQVEYMIKHNYLTAGVWAGAITEPGSKDPDLPSAYFFRRMGFYTFSMMSNLFRSQFEHTKENVIYTGVGESPFIKTYLKLINPAMHLYELNIFYNNQNSNAITFMPMGSISFKNGIPPLTFSYAGNITKTKIKALQIYQGIGETQYFKINDFYLDYEDDILVDAFSPIDDITGLVTSTHVPGAAISLEEYSFGYLKVNVKFPTWGGFRTEDEIAVQTVSGKNIESTLYPNPSSQSATLYFSDFNYQSTYSCDIYDINGSNVRNYRSVEGNIILIDKNELPAGLYLYKLFENNESISEGKFVFTE